jgi:hypothetical protein
VSRDHQGPGEAQEIRRIDPWGFVDPRVQSHSYWTTMATVRTVWNAPVVALRAYTESV